MTRIFFAAGAIALAAAAASCGGESESKSGSSTAAVGAAFAGLERISETGVFDSAASKVVGTSCGPGKKLVGAGGRIRAESGPPGWIGTLQSGQVGLTRISPTDTLNGVIVTGAELNPDHLFNWALQSYGICETETAAHELEYVRAEGGMYSEVVNGAHADCPEGKMAIAVGGSVKTVVESDSGKVALIGVSRGAGLQSAWAYGAEIGTGTTNKWRVIAYAVCASEASVSDVVAPSASSPKDSSHEKYVFVDCPAGKKVIGATGGVSTIAYADPAAGRVVLTGIAIHGGPVPRVSAFAAETGTGTSANWSVTARAICATP
jgi:hypothetical protein